MNFKTVIISACASVAAMSAGAAQSEAVLWYQTPAKEWIEAVPLGNGRIGAMVYGGINRERVALNEITLWAGQRDSLQNDYCGPEHLAEIRQAFFEGDLKKGNDLTHKYLDGHSVSFGTHLPLGDMVIDFQYPSDRITDYRRDLDLATAVASTTFNVKDGDNTIKYTREYICDYPDDVLAMKFSADKPGNVNFTLSTDFLRDAEFKAQGNELSFDGKVDYPMFGPGGVSFAGTFRIVTDGGKVMPEGNTLKVTGADAATIVWDMRTDYDNDAPAQRAKDTVAKAAARGFDALRKDHVADHSALFNRMEIDLGGEMTNSLPTDVRLQLAKNGVVDPGFDAIFFQYGRYMQIASSRPNSTLCSNLQGIWNDNLACHMAWTCDYHLDININQNYWSPNKANLAECNEPMFKYVALLAKYGSETAKKLYGCDGWCSHTITNPWGFTANGGWIGWGLNVTAGAWLATELWSHYLYTLDEDFLRETGYPLLKSCAEFFVDYMVEDPKTGYLVTGPSISPENGYKLIDGDGTNYPAAMMPTIDRFIVERIYTAVIEGSKVLGVDKKFRQRLEKDLKRMPPVTVGKDGLVKEWLMYDAERTDPSHRHSSHLVGLYPFGMISQTKTPELFEGAKRSLAKQTSDPNWEDTEWSTGNMICFNAFLKDGDKAHGWIQNLFKAFTRENLMTVSPAGIAGAPSDIFSFDATEASVAGMCDMLVQSHDGYIELLPALPSAWPTGSVKGLCAQGALTVDLNWKDSKPVSADIRAEKANTVNLLVADNTTPAMTVDGKTVTPKLKGNIASINLKPGQTLTLRY